jgi:hypothetical protein
MTGDDDKFSYQTAIRWHKEERLVKKIDRFGDALLCVENVRECVTRPIVVVTSILLLLCGNQQISLIHRFL